MLIDLGGEATFTELSDFARKRHSNRSLHTYLGERLKAMEKKGIVENPDSRTPIWRLTEKGKKNRIGNFSLEEIDDIVTKNDLEEVGIKIANVVGSLELESQLMLDELSEQIPNAEYFPETSPSLVFRDEKVTILAHSTGRVSITGGKSKDDLIRGTENFVDVIRETEPKITEMSQEIFIDNIVVSSDLGRELDLSEVAVALQLENVEYNPEQFPGLIYRSQINPTVLIFNSGKCVITGSKTFTQALDVYNEVTGELAAIGVEL